MKKNKRILIWMVLWIIVFSATGCGTKEFTEEEFIKRVMESGYTVHNAKGVVLSSEDPTARVIYTGFKPFEEYGSYYTISLNVFREKDMMEEFFSERIWLCEFELRHMGEEQIEINTDTKFVGRCANPVSKEKPLCLVVYKYGNNVVTATIPESDLKKVEKILRGTGF